jgi:hypothetical protein
VTSLCTLDAVAVCFLRCRFFFAAQIKMPQYESDKLRKVLGSSKGSSADCGIRGKQGVGTRFAASENVKKIKSAVEEGLGEGQTLVLKLVLATGYTANESGKAAAVKDGITLLDLPAMQKYWVSRLRESTSPFVDHLRVRPPGGK